MRPAPSTGHGPVPDATRHGRGPRGRILAPALFVAFALIAGCAGSGDEAGSTGEAPAADAPAATPADAPADTVGDTTATTTPDTTDATEDTTAAPPTRSPESGVRFALEVASAPHPPTWVQVNTESRPLGWLRVTGPDGPVDLEPRCDVPDCGEEPVVCGAAVPTVRRIAAADGAGSVEYVWDGTTSEIVAADACERRVPAAPGPYTAEICWADEGPPDAPEDPTGPVMGRLEAPTCVERSFTLGADTEVVVRRR